MAESKEVCFVKAVGLFLVGAKKGEDPYHALLLVDPLDALNTALVGNGRRPQYRLGHYELFGIVAFGEILRHPVVLPRHPVVSLTSSCDLRERSPAQ